FVSGTFDPRWNNDILNPAFHSLHASDFEVVELGWRGTTTSTPAPTPTASCTPSGTPSPFTISQSGRFVVLNWAGVAGATTYEVEVGSDTGRTDILVAPVGSVTTVSTIAAPGVYFVRVRGRNSCGTSGPSNELVVTIV